MQEDAHNVVQQVHAGPHIANMHIVNILAVSFHFSWELLPPVRLTEDIAFLLLPYLSFQEEH